MLAVRPSARACPAGGARQTSASRELAPISAASTWHATAAHEETWGSIRSVSSAERRDALCRREMRRRSEVPMRP
ncbi:hypothetical protein OB08_15650 [Microbacterium sp. HJ5]